MDPLASLHHLGLVPVLEILTAELAVPVVEALVDAGLPCAEVTFRTEAAVEAIALIADAHPGTLLGAGTVLTVDQADRAVDAGATFVVSPGFNPVVVEHCLSKGIPVIPGVCTPTEIEMALGHGINTVKFFPAEAMGGIAFLRALRAPYGDLNVVPTGGINEKNLADYLAADGVLACGGSWMVNKELLARGDLQSVRLLTAAAVRIVKQTRERAAA